MICKTCAWCADNGLSGKSHTEKPGKLGPKDTCPGPLHCDCQHKELGSGRNA